MNVVPYDPPLRFMVDSAKGLNRQYLVDLGEHKGNGQCDCPHFRCVLEPKVLQGQPGPHRCKHIKAGLLFLANLVVEQFVRDEKMRKQTNLTF